MEKRRATFPRRGNPKSHSWGVVSIHPTLPRQILYCALCKRFADTTPEGLFYLSRTEALRAIREADEARG